MDIQPATTKASAPRAAKGTLPATGFVRQSQLLPAIVPFSPSTLWRKIKAGTFPAPVKISERITAWPVDAVRAYLADPANYRTKA